MKDILSTIGLCSVALLLVYLIKKVYDHLLSKEEENKNLKIDEDDDDEL